MAALIAACRGLGVEILEQSRFCGWESAGRRIEAVRVESDPRDDTASHLDGLHTQTIPCERVCIASGAWAGPLLSELGIHTGILPVRGQMVLYRCPSKPFDMVVEEGHRYLVPRDDGRLLAGSCEEEVGFDASTTDEQIASIRQWAEQRMPMLQSTPVEATWAGLRPGSFDSYPYLGSLPPWENATIAAGHFRHGLHWSTGTAKLMVQWMAGEPTSIDLAPFSLQRGRTVSDKPHQLRD
jgi:glycine oxidase